MTTNKQDRKVEWEREHLQRVLDYHNKKYGAHIKIKGKSIDVYPKLKGQLNWDWVCCDTKTGEEIATEVKRITDSRLEEKSNIMWQLLEDVRDSLSGKLPGTFFLSINIPRDYYLPFNEQKNKQKLKRVLYDAIYRTAQKLKLGETGDLEPQIREQLSFKLPDVFSSSFNLHKFSDEGNTLYKSSGFTGWGSISFDSSELEEFEKIVAKANEQPKEANMKETFLVLIEEGYRPKDSPEVAEALKNINRDSYSEIRQVYFIRGDEVAEIPLPTN